LPWQFWLLVIVIVATYLALVELTKYWFDLREARRPETIRRQKASNRQQAREASQ
jgi:hypothetical protein